MDDLLFPDVLEEITRAPARSASASDDGAAVLGMPQLSGAGLSETWLLKELGHRHWMMLARAAGMTVPDFRDERGRPVYAAFCAVRIQDARFGRARENGHLTISASIQRVSRTQVLGRYEIFIDDHSSGTVEMVSTFVRRTEGSNHSIARVSFGWPLPVKSTGENLAALAAAFRAKRLSRHLGFGLDEKPNELAVSSFDPCPAQDFNGAGFLYFTSFLSFVDRAEWARDHRPWRSKVGQQAFFYGNVDPGETLHVVLAAERPADGLRWWQVRRGETNAVLADVFTQHARLPSRPSRC